MDKETRRLEEERFVLQVTEQIAKAMHRCGLNKAKLARLVGAPRSLLTRVMRGDDGSTRAVRHLANMATAMGYRLEVMLVPLPTTLPDIHPGEKFETGPDGNWHSNPGWHSVKTGRGWEWQKEEDDGASPAPGTTE